MFFENNRLQPLRTTSHSSSARAWTEEHARPSEVFIAVMTSRREGASRL
jgi:hypothetical protein